ncbi:hypothetical protein GALL_269360 [mine drainage metagenome]|uniref:GGDEF domain-containing protein n=1 Tax=mine drainage metagenome TaxID=410659 RepID=A0A1J5RNQ7_9ZZZZ
MTIEDNEIVINDIVARRAFLIILDWLLLLIQRFSNPLQFDMVHIEYGNNNELADNYGALDACQQLSLVTESLAKAFRKTDIVARDGTDFWVIAPYTSDDEKLHDKILRIFQEEKHHALNMVDREISIFLIPLTGIEINKLPTKSIEFLNYLKVNKHHLASHTFRFSATDTVLMKC